MFFILTVNNHFMVINSQSHESEELPQNDRVVHTKSRKNIWTTVLQIWAWLNVPLVGLAYAFMFVGIALLYMGLEQLGDVTKAPSTAPFYIALAIGLIPMVFSIWLALSLSTSEKVEVNRRFFALSSVIGGNLIIALFSILNNTPYTLVPPLLISALAFQAWRSSYRKADRGSSIKFLWFKLFLFSIFFTPITGAGSVFINSFINQILTVQSNVQEIEDETFAKMIISDANANAAFTIEDDIIESLKNSADEHNSEYENNMITGPNGNKFNVLINSDFAEIGTIVKTK